MSDEKYKYIIKLYSSGLKIDAICKAVKELRAKVIAVLRKDTEFEKDILKFYSVVKDQRKTAKNFSISSRFVNKILKEHNVLIKSRKIYEINDDYFEKIDTPEKAYFLGFLYTDGTIYSKGNCIELDLHKKDEKILHDFAERVCNGKYVTSVNLKRDSARISVYSKKMKSDLIKHGCYPRKTFTVRMPQLNTKLISHFLRGVFDGDGSLCIKKSGTCTVSLIGNREFVNDVFSLLVSKLKLKGSNPEYTRNVRLGECYFKSKNDVEKIIKYLYKDSTVHLERKFEKANQILEIIDSKKNPT